MKKIIKGKLYNTDTAIRIGSWDNGFVRNDFSYESEELYRKKTGEYFIYGEGGANTGYSHYTSDYSWAGGDEFMPISYETAKEWAEKHMKKEEYEKEFGEVTEGDNVVMTFSLPKSVSDKLRRTAAEKGVPMVSILTDLINTL